MSVEEFEQNDPDFKRQEIAEGAFLEKYQEKENDRLFYIFKIEIDLFQIVDITIDFSKSENLAVENSESMLIKSRVQPFSSQLLARLTLESGWLLKSKIRFIFIMPTIEEQTEAMSQPEQLRISEEINTSFNILKKHVSRSDPEDLDRFLKNSQIQFTDIEFPPNFDSLGYTSLEIKDQLDSLVQWRSLKEVITHPSDSKLTVNCSKLTSPAIFNALKAMSHRPELILRLFQEPINCDNRNLCVRINYLGRWTNVELDYYFPCYPLGQPLSIYHEDKTQSWGYIIEKAMAKLFGGYNNLTKLSITTVLSCLANCPVLEHQLPCNNEVLEEVMSSEGGIIVLLKKDGLLCLVLETIKIDEHSLYKVDCGLECGQKMKNISESWNFWTPELAHKLEVKELEAQGIFWLALSTMSDHFCKIIECRCQKWNYSGKRNKAIMSHDQSSEFNRITSRLDFKLNFESNASKKVVIGLHQLPSTTRLGIGVVSRGAEDKYRLESWISPSAEDSKFYEIEVRVKSAFLIVRLEGQMVSTPSEVFTSLALNDNRQILFSSLNPILSKLGFQFVDTEDFIKHLDLKNIGDSRPEHIGPYELQLFLQKNKDSSQLLKDILESKAFGISVFSNSSFELKYHYKNSTVNDLLLDRLLLRKRGYKLCSSGDDDEVQTFCHGGRNGSDVIFGVYNKGERAVSVLLNFETSEGVVIKPKMNFSISRLGSKKVEILGIGKITNQEKYSPKVQMSCQYI